LKIATSLDGRIATASGESRWITGDAAREEVHRLRAEHDAVLVGSQTLLDDDPTLTVRLPGWKGQQPLRAVADGRLRTPSTARLFSTPEPVLVVHQDTLDQDVMWDWFESLRRVRPLFDSAELLTVQGCPAGDGGAGVAPTGVLSAIRGFVGRRRFHPEMKRAMQESGEGSAYPKLHELVERKRAEIFSRETSVLIEGGGQLAGSFLRAGLVDRIEWFRAPILLGAEGRPGIGPLLVRALSRAPRFRRLDVRAVGDDLWERYERLP
jgi:diaminohydroxyphosphoribosylaminopyrimidine deaminase/5-amino-6-(5-phosphoribosylamino)uracil reductase